MAKKAKGKKVKTKVKKQKRKLNKKRFFAFLIIVLFIAFIIYKFTNTNIKNIIVKNNDYFTDQEIIDMAGLKNYPKSMDNMSYKIEDKLEKNIYILKVKVVKKNLFSKVIIKVEENYPLFYYQSIDKTILFDGTKVEDKFSVPTLINQVPDTIYDEFLKKMESVDKDILFRISEIQYNPNDVDTERFFLLMNDGNYVYLTLNKFLKINKYVDMIKSFNNKKGILYLDSGEYFDIFE